MLVFRLANRIHRTFILFFFSCTTYLCLAVRFRRTQIPSFPRTDCHFLTCYQKTATQGTAQIFFAVNCELWVLKSPYVPIWKFYRFFSAHSRKSFLKQWICILAMKSSIMILKAWNIFNLECWLKYLQSSPMNLVPIFWHRALT